MRRAVTALVGAAALAAPAGDAVAAVVANSRTKLKPRKRVLTVKKSVAGIPADAGRWGSIEVTLLVKKVTTIVGKHRTVKRTIVGVGVPIYPDHTDRSIFINQQALPLLRQEVLQAQFDLNIDMISGATDTSYAFMQSLQSALLKAQKV
jgi:uncharacterized protein with FMN-binding domain